MKKIPTIFNRDWEGNRGVINEYVQNFDFESAIPTEKVDGTNVRVTVRNKTCVRLEKRRNPSKLQKAKGIIDPWYVDADPNNPEDKYIFEAVKNTDLSLIPNGEHSAEAIGPNIQGNKLDLKENILIFFMSDRRLELKDVPSSYEELKNWLPQQRSTLNPEAPIEGVVWHGNNWMSKIKVADFK